jgi:hypothetical protein
MILPILATISFSSANRSLNFLIPPLPSEYLSILPGNKLSPYTMAKFVVFVTKFLFIPAGIIEKG